MNNITTELRAEAGKLLSSGEIACFIGYGQGSMPARTSPLFAKDEQSCEKLVWNAFCTNSLPTYLFLNRYQGLLKYEGKKMGLLVKGCDSRSVLRILSDKLFDRENVVIFGVPCRGTVDPVKLEERAGISSPDDVTVEPDKIVVKTRDGETKEFSRQELLNTKCLTCTTGVPVIYDRLLGGDNSAEIAGSREKVSPEREAAWYAPVAEVEAMTVQERSDFWNRQSARCIRCYACRNACPACNCRTCVFQQQDTKWTGKGVNVSDDLFYHITRAFHVAGRCVDCGECERVCPVGIPVQKLNRKIQRDMEELFQEKIIDCEDDIEKAPPLGGFLKEDPEEFL